jgi:hypothetical protein
VSVENRRLWIITAWKCLYLHGGWVGQARNQQMQAGSLPLLGGPCCMISVSHSTTYPEHGPHCAMQRGESCGIKLRPVTLWLSSGIHRARDLVQTKLLEVQWFQQTVVRSQQVLWLVQQWDVCFSAIKANFNSFYSLLQIPPEQISLWHGFESLVSHSNKSWAP